jgi:hypothetical protein
VSGPVPKRSEQRIRRNKPDVPVETVRALGAVIPPDFDVVDAHPLVVEMYLAMKESAQARYFEPSDWVYAKFALHFADGLLKSHRPSGQTLSVVQSMLGELLVSEGARRRVRLEVERSGSSGAEVLDIADMFRRRLAES